MNFRGQRWVFLDGNHEIIVENAWSMNGISMDRISIDGQVRRDSVNNQMVVMWKGFHKEPWITNLGEDILTVQIRSGLLKIHARVKIGKRTLNPADYVESVWNGQPGEWPDAY